MLYLQVAFSSVVSVRFTEVVLDGRMPEGAPPDLTGGLFLTVTEIGSDVPCLLPESVATAVMVCEPSETEVESQA